MRTLSKNNHDIWNGFDGIVAAVLSNLIQRESPLAREVLILVPELKPDKLVQEALRGSFETNYQRKEGNVQAAIDRGMAFLPWMREFLPEKKSDKGLQRNRLLESMIRGASFRNSEGPKAFYEALAARPELSAEERALVVQQRAKEILELHFRGPNSGSTSPGWEVLVHDSKEWLGAYDKEGAEEWFQEIEGFVLEQERSPN